MGIGSEARQAKRPNLFARALAWIRVPDPRVRGVFTLFLYLFLYFAVDGACAAYQIEGSAARVVTGLTFLVMAVLWWTFQPPIGCLSTLMMLLAAFFYLGSYADCDCPPDDMSHAETYRLEDIGMTLFWLGVAYALISLLRATVGEGKQQTERVKEAISRSLLVFKAPVGEEEARLLRASQNPAEDTLLRPAQGAGTANEERLVRPSSSAKEQG